MPDWLNMIVGVADSEGAPPSFSRETLQRHKILRVYIVQLVLKCLEMCAKIFEEKGGGQRKFCEQFDEFRKPLPLMLVRRNVIEVCADSEDLPRNISRESLQQIRALRVFRVHSVLKCMGTFCKCCCE